MLPGCARAVEFFRLLNVTQPPGLLNPYRGQAMDVRRGEALTASAAPSTNSPTPWTFAAPAQIGRPVQPGGVALLCCGCGHNSVTRTAPALEEYDRTASLSALATTHPLFSPASRDRPLRSPDGQCSRAGFRRPRV